MTSRSLRRKLVKIAISAIILTAIGTPLFVLRGADQDRMFTGLLIFGMALGSIEEFYLDRRAAPGGGRTLFHLLTGRYRRPVAEKRALAFIDTKNSTRSSRKSARKQLGVQSRHLMDWIEGAPFGFSCPDFADELVWRETLEGLQPSADARTFAPLNQTIVNKLY